MRVTIILMFVFATIISEAQNAYPLKEDVSSLDGIIKAYYEVVSGPEGAKQIERDRSIHHPAANVMITGVNKEGKPFIKQMTLKQYHENSSTAPFYEKEIHRVAETFGNITHVWSTYESRRTPEGTVTSRGINSIQLYNDGERWWVLSWVYDSERRGNAIPKEYLPE